MSLEFSSRQFERKPIAFDRVAVENVRFKHVIIANANRTEGLTRQFEHKPIAFGQIAVENPNLSYLTAKSAEGLFLTYQLDHNPTPFYLIAVDNPPVNIIESQIFCDFLVK